MADGDAHVFADDMLAQHRSRRRVGAGDDAAADEQDGFGDDVEHLAEQRIGVGPPCAGGRLSLIAAAHGGERGGHGADHRHRRAVDAAADRIDAHARAERDDERAAEPPGESG
ncbi:hypothetical protein WR25_14255 [Diploscapter pachys]|uniref:Uncharacterized protein n=1 Tax=Diploscapter pachys TaxID=2018661 RepID=A0A2A2KEZ1_9BILA|nr:hypothetical protein WR25_14255 [Diploscapter pachys]